MSGRRATDGEVLDLALANARMGRKEMAYITGLSEKRISEMATDKIPVDLDACEKMPAHFWKHFISIWAREHGLMVAPGKDHIQAALDRLSATFHETLDTINQQRNRRHEDEEA